MRTFFRKAVAMTESSEDFHLGATITMVLLTLAFISASFYIAVFNS